MLAKGRLPADGPLQIIRLLTIQIGISIVLIRGMTIHYEMFIETRPDGIVYDIVRFDDETEAGYWGEEVIQVSDGIRQWEHAIEDIAIYQPTIIKVSHYDSDAN